MDYKLWRNQGPRTLLLLSALLAAEPAAAQVAQPGQSLLRASVAGEGADSTTEDPEAATAGAGAGADEGVPLDEPESAQDTPAATGLPAGTPAPGAGAASTSAGAADGETGDEEPGDGLLDEPDGPADGDIAGEGLIDDAAGTEPQPGAGAQATREPPEDLDPLEPEPGLPRTAYPEDERDPFEAAGIGLGSFRLLPEMTAGTIITDNVQQSAGGAGDAALELASSLRLISEWSRHSLEATASARATLQERFPDEDDREWTLGLRGQLDISEETALQGEIGYEVRQQSRGDIDFPTGAADRPEIATTRALLALDTRSNRLFGRVALRLRRENESSGSTDAPDAPAANDDFSEGEVLIRAGYEVSPGLTVFAEGGGGRRSFDQVADSDRRLRDASLSELRGGVAVALAPKLRGELAIGHARLDPDDARLEGADGVVLDGSLEWQPSALTTVSFRATSTLEPTTLAGAAGELGQTYDLEVRHELRRTLAVTAGVGVDLSDLQGAGIEETSTTGRLGAEYVLSREWALLADYEHLSFESSEAGRDYTASTLRLAVRLRR